MKGQRIMKIETKYKIGQHVWVVYENNGEVCVYDDYIVSVTYDNNVKYVLKEDWTEVPEEEIILYEDTKYSAKLVNKIKEIMQKIREKEGQKDVENS